jgi:hypothetical protein
MLLSASSMTVRGSLSGHQHTNKALGLLPLVTPLWFQHRKRVSLKLPG